MNTFPTLPEPKFKSDKTLFPAYRGTTDSPYQFNRRKWTASKGSWEFEWDEEIALLETSYQTLRTFFLTNQGLAFTWVHPKTSVSYTVVFDMDELDFPVCYYGYRAGSIKIREQ